MQQTCSVFVAGHRGMVGSAVVRLLRARGYQRLLLPSRAELDLLSQFSTQQFFARCRPDVVVFAAAKVGGILANSQYPADFMYQNLMLAANSIHAAFQNGVSRFLFLGSTCIYPRMAPQPILETALLTSPLEPTNEAYALAKIAGIRMCQYYRRQHGVLFHSAMPTNLYGPGDNYHPKHSHVLPALIRRFHEARERRSPSVTIWGTGTALREFLHVDDLALGILHLLNLGDPPDLVNIGSGQEISILQLARLVATTVGYEGSIETDATKPDGTPRKLCDIGLMAGTGWRPVISLKDGLKLTYQAFLQESAEGILRSV